MSDSPLCPGLLSPTPGRKRLAAAGYLLACLLLVLAIAKEFHRATSSPKSSQALPADSAFRLSGA